jgi:hypothetical protein
VTTVARRFVSVVERELGCADHRFRRSTLPEWDRRWHELPTPARQAFATAAEHLPYHLPDPRAPLSASLMPAAVRPDLTRLGFLAEQPGGSQRLSLGPGAVDFARRLGVVMRHRLLRQRRGRSRFRDYVWEVFEPEQFRLLQDVLRGAGLDPYSFGGEVPDEVLASRRWPGWVAARIKDPLAQKVIDLLRDRGPLAPSEVPALLPRADPDAVRTMLTRLLVYLVVFEDVDEETYDLRVGLLPGVRRRLAEPEGERRRPELPPSPAAVAGPPDGVVPGDLRTVLFELTTEPARVKQTGELFARDAQRLVAVLEPLPGVLVDRFHWDEESRLDMAVSWAQTLRLVRAHRSEGQRRLSPTPEGRQWLAGSPAEQFKGLCDFIRRPAAKGDPFDDYYAGDVLFLHTYTAAVPGKVRGYLGRLTPDQRRPLRDALFRSFRELPLNVFVRLTDFLAHAAFAEHNPVLLGRGPDEVTVVRHGRAVPPLEEMLEQAGGELLEEVLRERLLPLGCVQAGTDERGQEVLIARRPRLDVFFGHEPEEKETATAADAGRVVVQPDFTVVLIGMNPAPAAELMPFCERGRGGVNQGSLTLRLTRDAVLRGLAGGLRGEEILERLRRLSSVPLPANVEEEVRGWIDRVGRATVGSALLLRCGDRATADRAAAALGKNAERLNETVLALVGATKSGEMKKKLLAHGILLGSGGVVRTPGKGRRMSEPEE